MITDKNNILSCLKTFFVHGDFENTPDDFDISDEIKGFSTRIFKYKESKDDSRKIGERKPTTDTKVPTSPSSKDPFENGVYPFKEDKLLELLHDTLQEIRDFEDELDHSYEQLENKFNKNEYQYETASKY